MKHSYRIFRAFGIAVELHITFILFLLLITMLGSASVVFWLSIFTVVLMHEFIHSLVAMGFGIHVPKITLTPIGGLASIEVPEDPKKEILISIAGPFSNFVLAAMIYTIFVFSSISPINYGLVIHQLSTGSANIADPAFILSGMLWVNVILGLFNIVPGFPMDGGRVLRAVLVFWMDYIQATKIAVRVGQMVALLLIIAGIFKNFWLILIGIFLYYAGNSELQLVKIKHALRGLNVGAIAVRDLRHANKSTTIEEFFSMIARPGQDYYPISDHDGRILGILDIQDIKNLDITDRFKVTVSDVAKKSVDVLDAKLDVEGVIGRILSKDFLLVVDEGSVVGYLTPESMFEAARFHTLKGKKLTQRAS